jgi:DNA-binding transcriptional MerR regulator
MNMRLSEPYESGPLGGRRGSKSADAFRTISEVAQELEVPQHVLRFWESKFPQVKPLKRAGGRRYYRPDDVALLRRIRQCLYDQGYTIKGVQKLMREGALKTDEIPRLVLPPAARERIAERVERPEDLRKELFDLRRELLSLRSQLRKTREG